MEKYRIILNRKNVKVLPSNIRAMLETLYNQRATMILILWRSECISELLIRLTLSNRTDLSKPAYKIA